MSSSERTFSVEMPFHNVVDYDVEVDFESTKQRIQRMMDDNGLLNFIKQNHLNEVLNPDDAVSCEYYDEVDFNKLYRNRPHCLNILSLNIVSLPKHGGDLLYFLSLLRPHFQIIVLVEIGARNISTVEHLLPGYTFYHVLPKGNYYGGVGIYLCNSIENVSVMNEYALIRSCQCLKCNFESLFINFTFRNKKYTVGGYTTIPMEK